MPEQPYVLYAEDDSDDQAIMNDCMRRVDPAVTVHCLFNGQLLFQFLEDIPPGKRLPSCIILDMNMPVWSGMETLAAIKQHAVYKSIPAFIFTTSSTNAEREQAEMLQAEAYITKPYAQTDLFRVCREFAEYTNHAQQLKPCMQMI